MYVHFDWQAGDEKGRWETVATIRCAGLRVPWWAWSVLGISLVALAAGGWLTLRHLYARALDRAAFQVQCVADLEARALERGDLALYLAQQDPAWPAWYARQARPGARRSAALPVRVHDLELRGDVAWVEVGVDDSVRQVRFYRRTDQGWVHTAPRAAFWGDPVERRYGEVRVRCRERDLPYVEPLIAHMARVYEDVCTTLGCPAGSALEVDFVPADRPPALSRGVLSLPSPWLSGIPIDGTWEKEYLDDLAYWAAYVAAWHTVHAATGRDLNPLQEAVVAEYAALTAGRDLAQVPLLLRVVERHGVDALPAVLDTIKEMRSLAEFLGRWLDLDPSAQAADYFQTLLNVEREALLTGRRDTFMLLQDGARAWRGFQAVFYDLVRSGDLSSGRSMIQVQAVTMVGDRALVTLREQAIIRQVGFDPKAIHRVGFFRLQDGDWKRTWTARCSSGSLDPILGPTPASFTGP